MKERAVADGDVRLRVPARPEFLRLARLTATGMASRAGFTYDEIEDLRIAVDELCFFLIGTKGREGTINLVLSIESSALTIEGTASFDAPAGALTELSARILEAVVDEHKTSSDGDAPSFRLRKQRHPA